MTINNLYTHNGENLATDAVLQEYPRPQLMRKSYVNLNGMWEYAINGSAEKPAKYDGEIIVPFSPESLLSGVSATLHPKQFLHYFRTFSLPKYFIKDRVLLNFGAVDTISRVFINDKEVGGNEGGYNTFTLDITDALVDGENSLRVVVTDDTEFGLYPRGKQQFERGGIWYTPQSGIWQTVWLESVPEGYIQNVKITPLFDDDSVKIQLFLSAPVSKAKVIIHDFGQIVAEQTFVDDCATVKIENPISWSPENPHLYDLEISAGKDSVTSYFGMRKFSIGVDKMGFSRIMLNNKPYFMNGLLDQGYWSDGLYTAADDKTLEYDILKMKRLGFNTLRKHIKVEPMRWYYHCDRLGMIVWQDMVSAGMKYNDNVVRKLPFFGIKIKDSNYKTFGRTDEDGKKLYSRLYKRMIDQLYNVTSIAVWVPFNEGWGQFDAKEVAEWTKQYDESRLVDHASGWHDQGGRDFDSLHIYFKKIRLKKDKLNRPIVVSEFGGYSYKVQGHSYNLNSIYGYGNYTNVVDLQNSIIKLYEREIIPNIARGLCASIYTQVSDVEDEVNGILTYDRKVCKLDEDALSKLNSKVKHD